MSMDPQQLRALRKALGFTQSELAVELDFSPGFIGEMERGEKAIERRTEYAVRYMLHRERSLPPRITSRVSEIAWHPWAGDGWEAEIDGFTANLRPAHGNRWAIYVVHKNGYGVPWPKWEASLEAAKASAILHVQLGLLDLHDIQQAE